tara:strand:- start:364 stop:1218 length:855 start_codon:yes stop_codon:yes gene_type:complete
MMSDVYRIAAFAQGNKGGNPAGVMISEAMLPDQQMLAIAHEVGYSETAFLYPQEGGWRTRYFAPEIEVPFCGHATIATGALLGEKFGEGRYSLTLNDGNITVDVEQNDNGGFLVALQSPKTSSQDVSEAFVDSFLQHFNFGKEALDPAFPVRIASGGARHLILMLKDKPTLEKMAYEFEPVKALMLENSFATISLLYRDAEGLFHSRNAFASGGVYEDPATGAAAAALAGYLRDINWPEADPDNGYSFDILQGEDMGSPSSLRVSFTEVPGSSIRVSGEARHIT